MRGERVGPGPPRGQLHVRDELGLVALEIFFCGSAPRQRSNECVSLETLEAPCSLLVEEHHVVHIVCD